MLFIGDEYLAPTVNWQASPGILTLSAPFGTQLEIIGQTLKNIKTVIVKIISEKGYQVLTGYPPHLAPSGL
jgi:hypothetical protein